MASIETLILTALKFRDTQLWNKLDDAMIFAVKLKSGEKGYCCVMGNAGEHYSLGFYRGDKGFATYLKTLYMMDLNPIDQFELLQTFDCINCDFVAASDPELLKTQKDLVKKIATDNGMKIRRPNGWPCFVRINCASNLIGLTDPNDISDMTLALEAALDVAEKVNNSSPASLVKLGFDHDAEYASMDGGKSIPLLTPERNGQFKWTKTKTPAFAADEYEETIYSDLLTVDSLKRKKHAGILQARFIHLPSSFGNRGKSIFPQILILGGKADDTILPVMVNDEAPSRSDFLTELGHLLVISSSVPTTIEVSDDSTQSLLADFCDKVGIKLKRVEKTSALDQPITYLYMQMRGGMLI